MIMVHSATKCRNGHVTRQVGDLAICMTKTTQITVSSNAEFYTEDQWGMEMSRVIDFGGIKQLACRAISASAELRVILYTAAV